MNAFSRIINSTNKTTAVKVYGPYSLSKNVLKDDGCLWLIKCSCHIFLGNMAHVGHFNSCSQFCWQHSFLPTPPRGSHVAMNRTCFVILSRIVYSFFFVFFFFVFSSSFFLHSIFRFLNLYLFGHKINLVNIDQNSTALAKFRTVLPAYGIVSRSGRICYGQIPVSGKTCWNMSQLPNSG